MNPTPEQELSFPGALAIANRYVEEMGSPTSPLVIVADATIEKPYGWIFFYQTDRFLRTGDRRHALCGNAPFLVERRGGQVVELGTAEPVDAYIARYEASRPGSL